MKTLTLNQMENVHAGTLKKALACVSQTAGGVSILFTLAAIGSFAIGPVGWLAFGAGALSFLAGAAADPSACDF